MNTTATPPWTLTDAVAALMADAVDDRDEDDCLDDGSLRVCALLDPENRETVTALLVADGFLVPGAEVDGVQTYTLGERSVWADYEGPGDLN
jgi:hypothetical protein